MVHPIRIVALGCLAGALSACETKSDAVSTHATLTGASVARVAAVTPSAHESDIARFRDEKRLTPTAAIVSSAVRVRRAPGGEPIVVLSGGAEVIELARARDHYLVECVDPHNHSQRVQGWIYKDAVESWGPPDELAATGSKGPACAKGDIHVQSDHDFCAKPCHEDGDCQGTGVCDGDARVLGKTQPGRTQAEHARYCVAVADGTASP